MSYLIGYNAYMNRTFIETKYFTNKWHSLGFSDDALRELQQELLENPKKGPVMSGCGGLRKVRFALEDNRGKSHGVRVCYIDISARYEIHLIDVFAKGEKENLSQKERNDIKQLVMFIKEHG